MNGYEEESRIREHHSVVARGLNGGQGDGGLCGCVKEQVNSYEQRVSCFDGIHGNTCYNF